MANLASVGSRISSGSRRSATTSGSRRRRSGCRDLTVLHFIERCFLLGAAFFGLDMGFGLHLPLRSFFSAVVEALRSVRMGLMATSSSGVKLARVLNHHFHQVAQVLSHFLRSESGSAWNATNWAAVTLGFASWNLLATHSASLSAWLRSRLLALATRLARLAACLALRASAAEALSSGDLGLGFGFGFVLGLLEVVGRDAWLFSQLRVKCALVLAHTVRASRKDRDDRQEVFSELFWTGAVRTMENHEFGARSITEELEELEPEAAEAVAVGHDNSLDSSRQDSFQKGTQSGSLEVETGADVNKDCTLRVGVVAFRILDELGLLVGTVGKLLAGRDAGVHDDFASSFCLFVPRLASADVDATVAAGGGRERDLPTCGPGPDGSLAYSIVSCSKRSTYVLAHQRRILFGL